MATQADPKQNDASIPQSPTEREPLPSLWLSLTRAFGILALTAASVELCRLCLSPIYDAMSSTYHPSWEINIVALVYVVESELGDPAQRYLSAVTPTFGCIAPIVLSFCLDYSGLMGPRWGPLLTSFATILPSIFFSLSNVLRDVVKILESRQLIQHMGPLPAAPPLLVLWVVLHRLRKFCRFFLQLCVASSRTFICTRFGLQFVLSIGHAVWAVTKRQFWAVPLALVTVFNTHIPTAFNDRRLNATLQEDGYLLLARQESVTGYISVLDNIEDEFRVMRCDHSLLGGEWLIEPAAGVIQRLREPIYSVFVILEAVRLVEAEALKGRQSMPDNEKSALVM